jgi:hypothetical protein
MFIVYSHKNKYIDISPAFIQDSVKSRRNHSNHSLSEKHPFVGLNTSSGDVDLALLIKEKILLVILSDLPLFNSDLYRKDALRKACSNRSVSLTDPTLSWLLLGAF